MSAITDKLKELEDRVAALQEIKQKHEVERIQWYQERKELSKEAEGGQNFKEAWIRFMGMASVSVGAPGKADKMNVNLEETALTVNVSHLEKTISMTTGTVAGKILFCALNGLSKDGFSEVELSEAMKEHGWNVGHNTLAPSLGQFVRDGYLIKVEKTRPIKYRLPAKLKMTNHE